LEDGTSAETAVVGNEAIVGIAVFMGGESRLGRAVVLGAGHGFRLGAQALRDEFERSGPLMKLLLRYTQALIRQIAQTAVCNRHHSLDQPLCRWLLLSLDHLPGDDIVMTQQVIANMLGVRREGVTEAALEHRSSGSSTTRAVTSRCSTVRAWRSAPASVTRWSRTSTTGCCLTG
jgi:CRP-like cAMP-binding protein